ncbi:MAG: HEAT repeat domain-containing protein [Anaerolineae bacterium]|nr:HEAT repeat domain-containing protein [Anaerolineae bacterium]
MTPSDDLTGQEPALGGELRPARVSFAPWPYPAEVAELIDYYQDVSVEAVQHSLITTVAEELHPHLMAAAIAAVRDPSSPPNLRRSAAVLLDIILALHWVWEWVDDKLVALLNAPRANTDAFVDYYVREALAHIAQMRGDPPPAPPTVRADALAAPVDALQAGTVIVRQQATAALGALGDIRAAVPLRAALADPDKIVRRNAIRALGALGARIQDGTLRTELFTQLLDIVEQTPHARLREAAVSALGCIGLPPGDASLAEHTVTRLAAAIGEAEASYVREAAIAALGCIGAPIADAALRARAFAPLVAALERGTHYTLRYCAADALGEAAAQLDDARQRAMIVQALIGALSDNVPDVRYAAACALGRIGAAEAVDALTDLLEDRNRDVRARAAAALDQICGETDG